MEAAAWRQRLGLCTFSVTVVFQIQLGLWVRLFQLMQAQSWQKSSRLRDQPVSYSFSNSNFE
jgi:hypothetical protein